MIACCVPLNIRDYREVLWKVTQAKNNERKQELQPPIWIELRISDWECSTSALTTELWLSGKVFPLPLIYCGVPGAQCTGFPVTDPLFDSQWKSVSLISYNFKPVLLSQRTSLYPPLCHTRIFRNELPASLFSSLASTDEIPWWVVGTKPEIYTL